LVQPIAWVAIAFTTSLSGHWHRWLANHPLLPDGSPSLALLQRILATLNSYYGFFSHANTGNYANTCIIMNLENCAAIFYPMALAIITCVSARPGFPRTSASRTAKRPSAWWVEQ
jgi:hypothetical protein